MTTVLAVNVLNPHSLLAAFGVLGVGVVLFAETGQLIGFFLPGDSLLFTAGVLAAAPASAALRTERYLTRYGCGRAFVLARFVPVVRTVLNPLAGIVGVPVRVFTAWQIADGLLWSVGLVLAGYLLGSQIDNVDRYLLPIIAVIIVVWLIPLAVEVRRARRSGGVA